MRKTALRTFLLLSSSLTQPVWISALTLVTLSTVVGCKVTADDIETWKGTVKGPGKIVAVLLAERYPMELRTRAALAMVEIDRTDEDYVSELVLAMEELQQRSPQDSQQIVDAMVPRLRDMMQGTQAAEDGLGPALTEQRAKDAGYALIQFAGPEGKQALTEAVVGWFAVNFAERSLAGNYSAEQVIRALGGPAARQLVAAMSAQQPQAALVKLTELIQQAGTDETKREAGERIVAIEREMESAPFVEWIKGKIREARQAEGRQISDAALELSASLTQDVYINDGALPAMKHLASQPGVATRLLEIAQRRPPASMRDAGALEAFHLRRQRALQALEGNAQPDQLNALLDLALDANNPPQVVDYAYDRIGDIGSRDAIPRLWPVVQNGATTGQRLRWRAGELVLALGGTQVLAEFMSKLPSDRTTVYEPEELAGYATRISQMSPPPVNVMQQWLRAPQWYAQVIALRYFERRGTQEEVTRLSRLTGNATPCVGPSWASRSIPTVGKVAESAVAAMRERLAAGASPSVMAP